MSTFRMRPTIYLARHAECESNINVRGHLHTWALADSPLQDSHSIRDAVLTDNGKAQCRELKALFPYHDKISIVMSSPLRRAIQTAAFSFGPTLRRRNVQYLVIPLPQEVTAKQTNIGHSPAELEDQLPEILTGEDIGFDPAKIDFDLVEDG